MPRRALADGENAHYPDEYQSGLTSAATVPGERRTMPRRALADGENAHLRS
jgi:hypothetical protein